MAQVIIVSNRLPVSVKKENGRLIFSQSLGGLATGLSSYVKAKRGSIWIGWPGIASDELSSVERQIIADELAKDSYFPVFLTQNQIDKFYNGYSNSLLWPLFHSLPVRSVNGPKQQEWWEAYRAVNRQYAEVVDTLADPTSRIWIHDYLLMLLPGMVKSTKDLAHIGFFLHIPFPTAKRFSRLAQANQLIKGLLAADLIGFHTSSYLKNFTKTVESMSAGEVGEGQIEVGNHITKLAEFPMGIDYDKFAEASKLSDVKATAKFYKKKYKGKKVIVSVDRLDPSKGLVERLKAYKQFLDEHPSSIGKVVFVMVAAPSRTDLARYRNLGRRLDKLAEEINEELAVGKWRPIEYINEGMPFEGVSALFQIADVAFIAPLRDGMNLTAKEFVASNKAGGALILSDTAGAAEELQDALIVDPTNQQNVADTLNQALNMRRRELKGRIRRMRKVLSNNTVQSWAKGFIDTLQQPLPGTPSITHTLNKNHQTQLLNNFKVTKKRLFLLDYDGSLVPFSEDYEGAKPKQSLIDLLSNLSSNPHNEVVVISGREAEELEHWFGKLPISLVAEHGAATKKSGQKWKTIEKADNTWKQLLLPSLVKFADTTPGASVEVKPHSLVWHYRAASIYHAQKNIVVIKQALRPTLKREGLELLQGNKVLEIKNPKVDKGEAAQIWLKKPYDFILAIGDDVTDESLFAVLPDDTYGIKIGRGSTHAPYRLASYKEVLSLLRRLASQS
jgi:trehalose 6-phosphate synthase/phosphatase